MTEGRLLKPNAPHYACTENQRRRRGVAAGGRAERIFGTVKIACSSASFAAALDGGSLTQLEWLDACANELEVDGVVFDARHFPRRDGEYLAQLRKSCVDLGLTVAGLETPNLEPETAGDDLEIALALGAPIVVWRAPANSSDPEAWGRFAESAKAASRLAKSANVTLALRNHAGTLCESPADLKRIAKDVDSAWLRFAPELDTSTSGETGSLLPKAAIAIYEIGDLATFATQTDLVAERLSAALQRYRGFVLLERRGDSATGAAYHHALERFAAFRARSLV